ncbi:MAG: hypothetical protein JWR48_20 [Mycobacterium sp.]|nr:hypothetical protein [Mycobacterium sp.]
MSSLEVTSTEEELATLRAEAARGDVSGKTNTIATD